MDRQRMFLIFGGAWISAALLVWFLWSQTKAPKAEKTVACAVATKDMPAGTKLKKGDVRIVKIPETALPKTAVLEENMAMDRVLLFPVSMNEPLTAAKLTSTARAEGLASTIDPGMRAISVQINDASGVSGLIQPRSRVDVLFTRPGSLQEAVSTTILEDVQVLSIGRATEVSQAANAAPGANRSPNTAATLIVSPEQAKKIELAKNEGKISLTLRNPLDKSDVADDKATTAEALNVGKMIGRRRNFDGPNVRDPNVWDQLTGGGPKVAKAEKKEPPKPRLIVDVFRGEKHVQEIFQ